MKLHIFALLFVVAGSYALPSANEAVVVVEPNYELAQESPIVNRIKWVIDLVSNTIEGLGLDPVELEGNELNIERPYLLKFRAFFENFRFAGASNIKIHNLEYSYSNNKLELDVSLPEIIVEMGDSGLFINVLSVFDILDADFRGSLAIKSIRLAAEIEVDISIISGISLRRISMNFSVGSVESDILFEVNSYDFSGVINNFFNERVPKYLETNENRINRSLEIAVSIIINIIWRLM